MPAIPTQSARPSSRHFGGIQALRGLAASGVVLCHAARHIDKVFGAPDLIDRFQAGLAGVDLFFVISGFIVLFVHAPDIGRPARLAQYIGRRCNRVLPLYWVALTVTIGMAFAGNHIPPAAGSILWSAFLLPSFDEPVLGIAWTLQFEMVFYAMFAVLVAAPRYGVVLMAAWLSLIAASAWGFGIAGIPPQFCDLYGLQFFLGMGAAKLARSGRVKAPLTFALGGLVLFSTALVAESQGYMSGFGESARLVYGGSACLMLFGMAAAEQQGRLSAPAAVQVLGGASYSIYLFQFIFIGIAWHIEVKTGLAGRLPHIASFALLAASAIIGGLAISRAVEQPLLRLMRGLPQGAVLQKAWKRPAMFRSR